MKKYKTHLYIISIVLVVWTGVFLAHRSQVDSDLPSKNDASQQQVRRIVSLAPSITESLFALGLGDNVVGVTRYCQYPAKVKAIEKVGGLLDPNFEAILRSRPDLVVMAIDNQDTIRKLQSLNLNVLVVHQKTVSDILDAMLKIGKAAGKPKEALTWVQNARKKIETTRKNFEHSNRPRVLVSMTRVFGTGTVKEVYLAGPNTFYGDLIEITGGTNAYDASIVKMPSISTEGIINLNPEVVIDIIPMSEETLIDPEAARAEWQSLTNISAVKNKRIVVLTGDYTVVPGPRFLKIMDDFATAVHPEVK